MGAVLCLAATIVHSQDLRQDLQQKVAAVKESAAQNQAALRAYSWTAHTAISHKGEVKKTKDEMCRYGPDGQVQKTEIGASAPPQEKRGIRGKIVEKKVDEMKDYMEQAIALVHLYVPPAPAKMQAVFQAGNASLAGAAPGGAMQLRFANYLKPGDSVVLGFDTAARKLRTMTVNTYMDDPQDAITLTVSFQTLPDGTNHVATTILNAPKKEIQVTTTNANYQKVAG